MATPYLSSYNEQHPYVPGMTRAGVGGERASSHLVKALAEIDGLFAGLNYIDKTDSSKQKADPAREYGKGQISFSRYETELDVQLLSQADEEMHLPYRGKEGSNAELHESETPQSIHESKLSSRYHWSSIRNVKKGSEHLWQRFDAVADNLDRPAINKIRNKYNDARGLREAGVFAFRDTVSGAAPSDLRQVFALASLSYVISCLLCKEGLIAKTDILSGIQLWRDAIQDDGERKAFVQLAGELWPEAHEHFHFIDLNPPPHDNPEELPFQPNCWTGNANGHAPLGAFQGGDQQLQSNIVDEVINMSFPEPPYELSGFNYCMAPCYSCGGSQAQGYNSFGNSHDSMESQLLNQMDQTHQTFHWSGFQNLPFNRLEDAEWLSLIPDDPPGDASGPSNSHTSTFQSSCFSNATRIRGPGEASQSEGTVNQCEGLRGTKTFKAIGLYLRQLSSLLCLLSGRGLTAKTPESVAAFNDGQQDLKIMIQEQYLDTLVNSQISISSQARAILALAKKFVKLGYLQSFSEVQDYMIIVGRVRSSVNHIIR